MIDDGMQEPDEGPYTAEEAVVIRNLQNKQILGCWWCLNQRQADDRQVPYWGWKRPYWPAERCEFRGHRIICPKHMKQEAEGLLETRA